MPSLTFTWIHLKPHLFSPEFSDAAVAAPSQVTSSGILLLSHRATLHGCIRPSKGAPLGWLFIHDQVGLPTWKPVSIPSGPQLLCADPEETLPDFTVLSDVSLFLSIANSSAPANQPSIVLVEPKLHFSGDGLLLFTVDSSASTGSEPQIFNSKDHTNDSGSLDFFLELHKSGLQSLAFLSVFLSPKLPQNNLLSSEH